MSIIQQTIVQVDTKNRYLRPSKIEQIKGFLMSGDRRLQPVKSLTESLDLIIQEVVNTLFQWLPNLKSSESKDYGKELPANCLYDMDYFPRLVTYSIVTKNTILLQDIGVIVNQQMYGFLEKSLDAKIKAKALEQSMHGRYDCPCCSSTLFRHICANKLYWRCSHCHQEMPVYNKQLLPRYDTEVFPNCKSYRHKKSNQSTQNLFLRRYK